jgi:S-disulfanyl-L-cysteine oxidoreductase SoxD
MPAASALATHRNFMDRLHDVVFLRACKATCRAALLLAFAGSVSSYASAADTDAGLFTEAQAGRGRAIYEQYCVACHGARLEGNPGAPLAGPAFLSRWADGKHTLDDLFYIVRSLMPYNAPGSLNRQQNADVTAYILKANDYPVGEIELPPTTAVLKKVTLQPR